MSVEDRPYKLPDKVLAIQSILNEMFDLNIDQFYEMICSKPLDNPSLYISVTNRCNLNCEYCYDKKSQPPFQEPVDMDVDLVAKIFKTIKDPDYVFVLGGEPLLNPSAIEAAINHCPSRVGVSTNGHILNENVKKLLHTIARRNIEGKPATLQFSCDLGGISEKRHTRESQRIENKLLEFSNICGKRLKVKYTLTEEDIPALSDIAKWYWDRNIFVQFDYADGAYGDGFPVDLPDSSMSDVYHFILQTLYDCFSQWLNDQDNIHIVLRAKLLINHVFSSILERIQEQQPVWTSCKVLGHSYYVSPKGELYPCHRFKNHRESYGIIGENKIEEIKKFHSEIVPTIRNYCKNCLYRGCCGCFCPAIVYGYGQKSVTGRCKFTGALRDALLTFFLDDKIRSNPDIDKYISIVNRFSPHS